MINNLRFGVTGEVARLDDPERRRVLEGYTRHAKEAGVMSTAATAKR